MNRKTDIEKILDKITDKRIEEIALKHNKAVDDVKKDIRKLTSKLLKGGEK